MQTDPQIVLRAPRMVVEMNTTTNRQVFNRAYKSVVATQEGLCPFCGWHKGENVRNYRKFGTKKARHKDHNHGTHRQVDDTVLE